MDTPAALKQRISGEAVIDVQIKNESAALVSGCLQALTGQFSIRVSERPPLQLISIRTPEPGLVLEKLAPYLNPQIIQGLEVRNQTLEDVYVAIIQGEKA
jgi:hypothetical protein